MEAPEHWRDALGMLSVALAIAAAAIYVYQTLRGEVRPHPLSWFVFGVLSGVGYWVQRDEGAAQRGSCLAAVRQGDTVPSQSCCRSASKPEGSKLGC